MTVSIIEVETFIEKRINEMQSKYNSLSRDEKLSVAGAIVGMKEVLELINK